MPSMPHRLAREQTAGLIVGAVALIACGIGLFFVPAQVFISWLFAFVFWVGLSLGCLTAAMMHYLTGGRWGNPARRILEAGYMTLPLLAVLFVPLLFGLHTLYPWARPDEVIHDKVLQQKVIYEHPTGFIVRAIFFFAVWIIIATRLRTWSLQQDDIANVSPTLKLRALSGPAIAIVPLTVTFALIDWVMSIEPAWYSTIFGVILLAGQFLAAIAFVTSVLVGARGYAPFEQYLAEHGPKCFHDLGSLLLSFVMFWTYVAFSQLLVTYSGNQPHEIGWYLRRIAGDWKWLLVFITAFHFFVPFFLLLFRGVKRNLAALKLIALVLLFVHVLYIFWVIEPSFYRDGIHIHWTDFAAWFGIGGFWLAAFDANLKRHPLLTKSMDQLSALTPNPSHAR